jgi:hypothetical protein
MRWTLLGILAVVAIGLGLITPAGRWCRRRERKNALVAVTIISIGDIVDWAPWEIDENLSMSFSPRRCRGNFRSQSWPSTYPLGRPALNSGPP